ncbi:hypothetical protein ACOME3_005691 [Neoechinorhynchus agilis]
MQQHSSPINHQRLIGSSSSPQLLKSCMDRSDEEDLAAPKRSKIRLNKIDKSLLMKLLQGDSELPVVDTNAMMNADTRSSTDSAPETVRAVSSATDVPVVKHSQSSVKDLCELLKSSVDDTYLIVNHSVAADVLVELLNRNLTVDEILENRFVALIGNLRKNKKNVQGRDVIRRLTEKIRLLVQTINRPASESSSAAAAAVEAPPLPSQRVQTRQRKQMNTAEIINSIIPQMVMAEPRTVVSPPPTVSLPLERKVSSKEKNGLKTTKECDPSLVAPHNVEVKTVNGLKRHHKRSPSAKLKKTTHENEFVSGNTKKMRVEPSLGLKRKSADSVKSTAAAADLSICSEVKQSKLTSVVGLLTDNGDYDRSSKEYAVYLSKKPKQQMTKEEIEDYYRFKAEHKERKEQRRVAAEKKNEIENERLRREDEKRRLRRERIRAELEKDDEDIEKVTELLEQMKVLRVPSRSRIEEQLCECVQVVDDEKTKKDEEECSVEQQQQEPVCLTECSAFSKEDPYREHERILPFLDLFHPRPVNFFEGYEDPDQYVKDIGYQVRWTRPRRPSIFLHYLKREIAEFEAKRVNRKT